MAYSDYSSDFNSLLEKDKPVTIHHRNIKALSLEIYKSVNNLNPLFLKEVCPKKFSLTFGATVWPKYFDASDTINEGVEEYFIFRWQIRKGTPTFA